MTAPQAKPDFPAGIYGITAEKFPTAAPMSRWSGRCSPAVSASSSTARSGRTRVLPKCSPSAGPSAPLPAPPGPCSSSTITRRWPCLPMRTGCTSARTTCRWPRCRLVGPHRLIGLSTHDPDQAAAAVTAGADYIGVGPLFATQTKDDVRAGGPRLPGARGGHLPPALCRHRRHQGTQPALGADAQGAKRSAWSPRSWAPRTSPPPPGDCRTPACRADHFFPRSIP